MSTPPNLSTLSRKLKKQTASTQEQLQSRENMSRIQNLIVSGTDATSAVTFGLHSADTSVSSLAEKVENWVFISQQCP